MKYFSYKNGFTNDLPNINIENFICVSICEHTEKEVLVLNYFGMDEPLHLHSEDDKQTELSVDLFKKQDLTFANQLEFFTEDNPHIITEILNLK